MLFRSTIVLLSCLVLASADHWGYGQEQPNGVIADNEGWMGQCSSGRRQSPIDLAEDASVIGRYPQLYFKNYSKLFKNARIHNTGHTLQIDMTDSQECVMTGGGLPGIYVMDQMHFHWASEHTINKQRFGLELHIVSHEERFGNFSTAVKNKRGVAVLAVLFHVSDKINPVLKNILDSAESVKDTAGQSSEIKLPFSPEQLLPVDRSQYFRYEGSLTTPSCDESVVWTILKSSVPFSISQIERFKMVKDSNGTYLTHNFRQVQRLNSRPLVYVKAEFDQTNSGANLAISMFTVSVTMFAQIAHSIEFV